MFYFILIVLIVANDRIVVYWLGIEISLIVFLPFLLNNKFGFELRIKYFLVQTIRSFILMIIFIFRFKVIYLFFFILLLKIGAVPFYSWVIYITVKIDWNTIFFFLSLLKIIPYLLIGQIYFNSESMSLFILANSLVGGLGGLGCLCIRKLIVFSSLGHTGWVLSSIYRIDYLWIEYFLIYILVFSNLVYIFFSKVIYHIKDIKEFSLKNLFIVILLVRFRGLPPFSLFIIKFYVISGLLERVGLFYILVLIFRSLIRLYYYLRVRVDSFITFSYSKVCIADRNISYIFRIRVILNVLILSIVIFYII